MIIDESSIADDSSLTHVSLLSRIRRDNRDPDAWREFVERYGRRIYDWCLARRLQPTDAEDVAQSILLKLVRRMESFQYNPELTFRGWLRRVTENTLRDFLSDRRSGSGRRIIYDMEWLHDTAARQDLTSRMEAAFDMELFEIAVDRVRGRVDKRRWQAWEMIAQENRPGETVAAELAMKVASVYSAKYQIQKLIAVEVRQLEQCAATTGW